MAKVKIQGNASGTGVLTVTAPNTSTDRVITLPDGTGTLIADNGSGQVGIETTTHHDATTKLTVAGRINTSNGTATGSMNYGGGSVVNMGALTNHPVNLMVNNSTKWVIDTSGNLIAEGGGGIVLGNTSYAAANELDDYETGESTITLTCTTSGSITLKSTHNKCVYTKVGRVVHFTIHIRVDSISSPQGSVVFNGLPFTSGSGEKNRFCIAVAPVYNFASPSGSMAFGYIANSATTMSFTFYNGSTQTLASAGYFQVNTEAYISGSYMT